MVNEAHMVLGHLDFVVSSSPSHLQTNWEEMGEEFVVVAAVVGPAAGALVPETAGKST